MQVQQMIQGLRLVHITHTIEFVLVCMSLILPYLEITCWLQYDASI